MPPSPSKSPPSIYSPPLEPPPPYELYPPSGSSDHVNPPVTHQHLLPADPRTSSSQSLCSHMSESDERRTLLLVFIHGFYGNDQSFQSFPYHLHAYLKNALAESHVIHTKVYPRYKTYRAIEVARDNFSEWLIPHESPTTDVVLVGHSMGGILAADVVLMPNRSPYQSSPFKHRILGIIALDTPFLGLHPGIVVAGISSLFQPAATSPVEEHGGSSSQMQQGNQQFPGPPRQRTDPLFDPPFFNDNPFREAPFVKRITHFAKKHYAEGLWSATTKHILSHLEYGGCLADFPALRARYDKVRSLEDVDDLQALNDGHAPGSYVKVRFVNYYTLSSGRHKEPKPRDLASPSQDGAFSETPDTLEGRSLISPTSTNLATTPSISSQHQSKLSISMEDQSDSGATPEAPVILDSKIRSPEINEPEASPLPPPISPPDNDLALLSLQQMDPIPMSESDNEEPILIKEETKTPDLEKPEEEPKAPAPPDHPSEESLPKDNDEDATPPTAASQEDLDATISMEDLPPIPPAPTEPEAPDFDQYADKDSRKQAEKQFKRQQKAYEQAIKDRNRAIRERQKILEKRRRKVQKEQDKSQRGLEKQEAKAQREQEKQDLRAQKDKEKQEAKAQKALQKQKSKAVDPSSYSVQGEDEEEYENEGLGSISSPLDETQRSISGDKEAIKKKKKKFCVVPGKTNGVKDPTWVDVYMDGMDEVAAHCGLFFPGPHYDILVGDAGGRVVNWVHEDLTKRTIAKMNYNMK